MKNIDCGLNPQGKGGGKQPNEVDCGFNPPRRGTSECAGPERATTEESVPAAPAVKHSRKS